MRFTVVQLAAIVACFSGVQAAPVEASTSTEMYPCDGSGILLTNKSNKQQEYSFFVNVANGATWGAPTWYDPTYQTTLKPGETQFVQLPINYKGRVQRGILQPATWVEFQLQASNDGNAWGDISLQWGADGAATITGEANARTTVGFEHDILASAPSNVVVTRADGEQCISQPLGGFFGGPQPHVIEYLQSVVGETNAYINNTYGTDVVASARNCLQVNMF